jgi:imidazolonepropionase-like amidohydrolase
LKTDIAMCKHPVNSYAFFLFLFLYLLQPFVSAAQSYALVADRLIDVKNRTTIEQPVVLVKDNKIVQVLSNKPVPQGYTVINLKGNTLLPGLMDVHTHLMNNGGEYEKELYSHAPTLRVLRAVQHLRTSLYNGFTTLRDVNTEGAGFADVDLRRAVDSGYIQGPRIFASGPGIAATGQYLPFPHLQNRDLHLPSGAQMITGVTEAQRAVRNNVAQGVNWIKLFADFMTPTLHEAEIQAVTQEAARYGIKVAAHANTPEAIAWAIGAEVASIEHGLGFTDSLFLLAKQKGVSWVPTLTAVEHQFPPEMVAMIYKKIYRAYELQVNIVCGTDVGAFPWQINQASEIESYVRNAGLPPMEALRTATIHAAILLGKQEELGSVEAGFLADIIAVKGNLLQDISLIRQVVFVMKEGVICKQPVGK